MWCGRKGIDCPDCGVFGECQRSACGLPNIETSTLGTSSSNLVHTMPEILIDDIKRKAVKEFAEKLKKRTILYSGINVKYEAITADIIDELLKEYEK